MEWGEMYEKVKKKKKSMKRRDSLFQGRDYSGLHIVTTYKFHYKSKIPRSYIYLLSIFPRATNQIEQQNDKKISKACLQENGLPTRGALNRSPSKSHTRLKTL